MNKTKIIKDIINNLNGVISGLEALAETFKVSEKSGEMVSQGEVQAVSEDIKNKSIAEPLTLEQVRATLVEKSQSGKQAQVKALITSYGVERLTEIPSDKYPELMQKAGEI